MLLRRSATLPFYGCRRRIAIEGKRQDSTLRMQKDTEKKSEKNV
jgi:hypothetical protein